MNKKEISLKLKRMFNGVREVGGVFVRWRGWDKEQWQIVDSLDFKTANTLKSFYYQKDCVNEIFNIINKK